MEEQKKNPAQGLSESEQVQVRRQKLADLQAAGCDPFTLTMLSAVTSPFLSTSHSLRNSALIKR